VKNKTTSVRLMS